MPKVSLSLMASLGNAERTVVAEEDEAEVRMKCEVDANPAAHAVKWFRDVSPMYQHVSKEARGDWTGCRTGNGGKLSNT